MLKIIISPAKKMNVLEEFPCPLTIPVLSERMEYLYELLKSKDINSLKTLWKCSDKLAEQNFNRLRTYAPNKNLTPSLLAYEGIQYQHIAPRVFTDSQWAYALSHLRILSGMYGVLSPSDGVIPYRLEMQAKLKTESADDLYGYWKDTLYQQIAADGTDEIINLASAEYSKAILPYIESEIKCVTCIFGELITDKRGTEKLKVKGTHAKIARGEMVRWMSNQQVEHTEDIKKFKEMGYQFRDSRLYISPSPRDRG